MKGDPKRENQVILYNQTADANKEATPESYHFLVVMLAMSGFMLRVKWGPWAALLVFMSGMSSSRMQDFGQMISTFAMLLVSFISNYAWIFKS